MDNKEIWTTGIHVKHSESGWMASSEWKCGNIGESGYCEGSVRTYHEEPTLVDAINNVLGFLTRLGIKRTDELDCFKGKVKFAISYQNIENKEEVESEAALRSWAVFSMVENNI